MKHWIAHRGNTLGPNPEMENRVDYVQAALANGFDVEVDVWLTDQGFFLGHDRPLYPVNLSFLRGDRVWCHAKNQEALAVMVGRCHCFWHQEDDVALTSKGYLWTYPGKILTWRSVCLFPSAAELNAGVVGFCADDVALLRK